MGIAPIHDVKWQMDQLYQKALAELGHHPVHVGLLSQSTDALEYLLHQSCPDGNAVPTEQPNTCWRRRVGAETNI